ncbi:MAG TPA: lysophospholipid acyltransferase family protein [Candidatus Dormibacteraeota bacterium]|nr:lysophospholipid acyltransferase family protein [Candidatus Dormibacteraeota bacterium]
MSGIDPRPPLLLKVGLQIATGLTRVLGPARYPLANAIGTLGYATAGSRRRNAVRNHRRMEPGIPAAEARRRARASFRAVARSGVDFVWACGLSAPATRRHGRWVPDGRDAELRDPPHGGIFALTHFGNWDMAANIAFSGGLLLTTVMATTGPRAITDLVVWARRANQMEVFEASHAAMGLIHAIRRRRYVAILCDLPESGPTVTVDYCGGPVEFSSVPAWLALRTGAPLIPTACWQEGGGYLLQPLPALPVSEGDDERVLMQRIAAALEPLVRAHPEQWYPFRRIYADE